MVIGWRDIVKQFKERGIIISERTLRRWVEKYMMPILRSPSGRPMFSGEMFEVWIMQQAQKPRKKNNENDVAAKGRK